MYTPSILSGARNVPDFVLFQNDAVAVIYTIFHFSFLKLSLSLLPSLSLSLYGVKIVEKSYDCLKSLFSVDAVVLVVVVVVAHTQQSFDANWRDKSSG